MPESRAATATRQTTSTNAGFTRGFDFSPNSSVFIYTPCLIDAIHICDKVDAAGDAPGDIKFPATRFSFDFLRSLENKAGLMELARSVVFMRGGHADDKGLGPRPPAEPPPHLPSNRVLGLFLLTHTSSTDCILLQLSGRVDTSSINPGGTLFLHCLGFAFGFAFSFGLEDKAGSKGLARPAMFKRGSHVEDKKFDLPPPTEPPPIPSFDDRELIVKRRRHRIRIILCYWDSKADHRNLISLRNGIGVGFTILRQLDYGIISILCNHGDKLLEGVNYHDRMLVLFCHSPRPPEFTNNKEAPRNASIKNKGLIEETCLQVQEEIELLQPAELEHLITNREGDISLDKWKLKLNFVNAQGDFRINYLQTHQREGTLEKWIKLYSSLWHNPHNANSVFK